MPLLCAFEVMSESTVKCCSSVLSLLKSHKDAKEDNVESGVEDSRKLISNLAFNFSYFVNADETTMTTATKTIEELCLSVTQSVSEK